MAGENEDAPYVIEVNNLLQVLLILIEGYKQGIISQQELIQGLVDLLFQNQ